VDGFERTFALEDIAIRAGGDGRTVTAYAAVFDASTEVHDVDGHYRESINRSAFNRTIGQGVSRFQVLFNHGMDAYGQPSDRFSMPIGVPLEMRADTRGLLTVTRYAKTDLADEVLELIREGAIRGQSFNGSWVRSNRTRVARSAAGELDHIERLEIKLREYGPTPFPVYQTAEIIGVRAETTAPDPTRSPDALRALHTMRLAQQHRRQRANTLNEGTRR
jgi:HK97 family phage prohead protease